MTIKRRILLCRFGFVLFCLLPTLTVGLWIASRSEGGSRVPLAKAALERELTSQLGLVVEIDRTSGSLDALHLDGMRIRDPETSAIIFQAAAVESIHSESGWRIEAFQPQLDATHLRRLIPRLHDRLLCGPAEQLPPIAFVTRNLILATDQQQHSVAQFSARLGVHDVGREFVAELHLPTTDAEPIRLTVARNQQANAPSTHWQLATGSQHLPLAALTEILPEVARLGHECQFAGTISGGKTDSGWSGELAGSLTNVDFDALVTEHFPHQLSGIGTVRIERAVVAGGRIEEFRGNIEIASGSISGSLLAAAEEHLQFEPAGDPQANEFSGIPFERLAIEVQLDGRMFRIRGLAGMGNDGTVLRNQTGPLLMTRPGHAVPAVNLLRALLPDNQFQVPATRQTDVLVGLLPVPDAVPTRTAARQIHVPTRLRTSGPAEAAPVLRQPGLR